MNIQDFLQKILSRAKIQKQLYYTFFIAILLPLALIGIVLMLNNKKQLTKHYENQVASDNLRVKSIMFDTTLSLYNLSENLATDGNLQHLISADYQSVDDFILALNNYTFIDQIYKNYTMVSNISIYSLNEYAKHNYFHYATDAIKKTRWYTKASRQANIFWMGSTRLDQLNQEHYELTLYRKIPLPSTGSYAVLAMSVSNNYLRNRIENNTLYSLISVNDDPIVYSSDRRLIKTSNPAYVATKQDFYSYLGKSTYQGKKVLENTSTLFPYQAQDVFYISTIDTHAYQYIQKITLNYLLIIFLILLIPLSLTYLFTQYFSARVKTLRQAMHKVSNGIYDIEDSFHGDDELSETFKDLNTMVYKIKKDEAKIYESAIQEKEITNRQQQMEFKMLASQINPHFLYNTLEMIRMKALTSGNRDVATAIKLLGRSMRYVLDNTGTSITSLKKEIDYIETYLAIQKLRFHDRVNYSIRIQEHMDIDDYQILPLLLQPVIENSILHGLEGLEDSGQIVIHIHKSSTDLLIDIYDNGSGMTKEELHTVMKKINHHDQSSTHSIGLYNISKRIHLRYGEPYGLKIKSKKNFGTMVTLKLPLNNLQEI
ncbi:MAG TPA: histidine kinase [Candidatus Merdenecus merdavium]|nr:histidine kinase [Candidatus Merdenecus merdavium]